MRQNIARAAQPGARRSGDTRLGGAGCTPIRYVALSVQTWIRDPRCLVREVVHVAESDRRGAEERREHLPREAARQRAVACAHSCIWGVVAILLPQFFNEAHVSGLRKQPAVDRIGGMADFQLGQRGSSARRLDRSSRPGARSAAQGGELHSCYDGRLWNGQIHINASLTHRIGWASALASAKARRDFERYPESPFYCHIQPTFWHHQSFLPARFDIGLPFPLALRGGKNGSVTLPRWSRKIA